MSVLQKITTVVTVLCAIAYICIALLSVFGFLPSVYEIPWAQVLLGIGWVGQAILNWKKMRIVAIINLVVAALAFATAFLGWFL